MNCLPPSSPLGLLLHVIFLTSMLACPWLQATPLRILAWDDSIAARKLALADSKEPVPIEGMHPSKRTKIYHVKAGDKPLTILALDKTGPDGKPAVSAVIIPQDTKHPLLLLLPDEKSAAGLRLIVFDDDPANFPWGTTRFINASGAKLAIKFDKKNIVLPASWTPVLVNPGGANRNMETQLFFFNEPASPIYSGIWEQQQDIRTLVFLVQGKDPRLGPVAMKMIPEHRRALEANAKSKAGK